jgi:GDP-4-dehydro-6-deoxy-D-mannose reductase
MRILVTGSSGFVGGWLMPELAASGHDARGLPSGADVTDAAAMIAAVADSLPDAMIHLAGVTFAPHATADPERAIRVNVGGTLSILEACRAAAPHASILIVSTGEVYAPPPPGTTLTEGSPLGPRNVYGLTKLAAEAVALELGTSAGLRLAVARSFNHTGPGQRSVFAVPAFADRILAAKRAGERQIRAGNVAVERDITDVRDVVRAYRLLVEALAAGRVPAHERVYNVASGTPTRIGRVIDLLGELASWPVEVVEDRQLVRADDPPRIAASAERLRHLTGWVPSYTLERTLDDLMAGLERRAS